MFLCLLQTSVLDKQLRPEGNLAYVLKLDTSMLLDDEVALCCMKKKKEKEKEKSMGIEICGFSC